MTLIARSFPSGGYLHDRKQKTNADPAKPLRLTPRSPSKGECLTGRFVNDALLLHKLTPQPMSVKLNPRKVSWARRHYRAGATANQIARRLKVSLSTTKNLLAGITWRSVPDPLGHGSGYPGASHGRRCSKAKLTDAKVREIRRRHAAGETQADLCREFKITACPMSRLIRGLTWKHVE
jgi:hypothetical protein